MTRWIFHSPMSSSLPETMHNTQQHVWAQRGLGKNTGVGCHFLLQCKKVKSQSEVPQLCPTLSDPRDCSLPGSSAHGIFQTRVLEQCGPNPTCVVSSWVEMQRDRWKCHRTSRRNINSSTEHCFPKLALTIPPKYKLSQSAFITSVSKHF